MHTRPKWRSNCKRVKTKGADLNGIEHPDDEGAQDLNEHPDTTLTSLPVSFEYDREQPQTREFRGWRSLDINE